MSVSRSILPVIEIENESEVAKEHSGQSKRTLRVELLPFFVQLSYLLLWPTAFAAVTAPEHVPLLVLALPTILHLRGEMKQRNA
jgi:hypothetical protein